MIYFIFITRTHHDFFLFFITRTPPPKFKIYLSLKVQKPAIPPPKFKINQTPKLQKPVETNRQMAQAARLILRMQKELKLLLTDPPPGASFPQLSGDSDICSSSLSSIDARKFFISSLLFCVSVKSY